jgi:superfamily II DNA or RNA helicase
MSFAELLSRLDPRPDVRGRQFERICAWYLRSAPEYRERIQRVWLWAEWPEAWAADAGIDLVAEERDGRLWAVQAKAYDPSYAIRKADVDSFLSESSRAVFSYRLLIATTDRLGPTARRTLDSQREPVGYLLRSQLELASVAWPASPDELRPRRPSRKRPLPHVREAVRTTVKGLAENERGQLIMACGTGKTLAAMWISERLGSKRTLVLLPSLSLLAQTLREWSNNASEPFEYLAVCSDATVVGEDEFVQSTAELGFPVTTDPRVIAAFLRRRGRRVVFATYQSTPQIAKAYRDRTPQFDLAIADEAHRCAGRASGEFATILDRRKIRSARRLFMTATPRFYTPRLRREAGLLDVEVASMDDKSVFGPVLHRLPFGEAIERDLLSDYQVVVVGVDNEMYRAWAERGELVTPDGEKVTDARSLAGQIGLAKAMRKYQLWRVISFHGRIKAAQAFSLEMPSVIGWMPRSARPIGAVWCQHVSGAMTSGHRDRLLLRFRDLAPGERGLLSNARCLGEGVDVPSIDGVAFIDPRRSVIDIVQALGRAIRKSPGKRVGTIVLPVFLSDDEDPDRVLDGSAFKHVWDVLNALRAHDQVLGEELDELRRRLGARRTALQRPGKIKLDVPRRVGLEFARAFDVRLIERTTTAWEFYFGMLQSFVERKGNARVPQQWTEDGYRLGTWVNGQRDQFRSGTLEPDRQARLEAVPGWTWTPLDDAWEEGFARLESFVAREGHARVPAQWHEGDYRLGNWVNQQRTRFRHGTLEPDRCARLEALAGWTWTAREDAWEDAFAKLRSFVEREGHARVPDEWIEDGVLLGRWVDGQRTRALRPERRARLEAVPGWTWDLREAAWEEAYACLKAFVERAGHARVPQQWTEDGYPLGTWVANQRGFFRRGKLERERLARLEVLAGWTWNALEAAWEEGFAKLTSFVEREGHARVPQHWTENGYPLRNWVNVQRGFFRRGKLERERLARLEVLAGWTWNARGGLGGRLREAQELRRTRGPPARPAEVDRGRLYTRPLGHEAARAYGDA